MKNTYITGKGIPPTVNEHTPLTGASNSNLDIRNITTGKLVRRRKIGSQGFAIKDLDVAHQGNKVDHAHDFEGKKRKKGRPLNKAESSEIKKAKRTRRPLNYDGFDKT